MPQKFLENTPLFFVFVWIFSLALYLVNISNIIFYDIEAISFILFFSIAMYMFGFYTVSFLFHKKNRIKKIVLEKKIDYKSHIFQFVIFTTILSILVYNLINYGLVPICKIFQTLDYNYANYGRFKGFLWALASSWLLISTDNNSFRSKLFVFIFVSLLFIAYLMRGPLFLSYIQYIYLLFYKSKNVSSKKIVISLSVVFIFLYFLITVLGNIRSGNDVFLSFMQIKDEYKNWPIGFLWLFSYISVPTSNLVIVFNIYLFDLIGSNHSFFRILPAFLVPNVNLEYSKYVFDGASAYPTTFIYDYGIAGLVFINILYGSIGGYISRKRKFYRNKYLPVYFSAIALMMFNDYLCYFPFACEFFILALYLKYSSCKKYYHAEEILYVK